MAYDHPLVQHVLKDDIYYIMNINEHYIIYNITIYICIYSYLSPIDTHCI